MHTKNNCKASAASEKDFWDKLQTEIILSNQNLTQDDMRALIEQSFLFSLFFRDCSQLETFGFQSLLQIKDYGYVILLDFGSSTRVFPESLNTLTLHHHIRDILKDTNHIIGPLIEKRIGILVSYDIRNTTDKVNEEELANAFSLYEEESLSIADSLIETLHNKYHLSVSIGVGGITRFHSIHSSFIDALRTLQFCKPNHRVHVKEIDKFRSNIQFDYFETEKHMLDAIRLGKAEAYDYFGILMNWIHPMNDTAKRNHILEILVMSAHATRIDHTNDVKYFNYIGNSKELLEYTGIHLIEWAYNQFIHITGYEKPQSTIDYSNKVVQVTKEYLEAHYTEDITLEDVAAQVNVSPQYFSKLIKKNTGFNFIDWLSMMRVRKAKELLNNSSLTVKEVCYMVGYKDPNYFSRIFKKRVGITPSEYIKNSTSLKSKG
ncbi:MAG: helix-turn-helix transcriptional regulator [Lachnospiraceae bacterium]|nr:helix-turn-helix transcriptional regulator [Lachnospiraceae bacterium]